MNEDELTEKNTSEPIEQDTGNGYGEMSQSRFAIWSAVAIILLVDIVFIVISFISNSGFSAQFFGTNVSVISSIVLDIILGIIILRGKNWARVFMLFRLILGLLLFGGSSLFAQDYISLIIQTGTTVAVFLLLTGTSSRLRIRGSLALFLVTYIGGIIWLLLPTAPISYSSYHDNQMDFSFRYPSDWHEYTKNEIDTLLSGESEIIRLIDQGNLSASVVEESSGNGVILIYVWDDDISGEPLFLQIDETTCKSFTDNFAYGMSNYNVLSSTQCTLGGYEGAAELKAWEIIFTVDSEGVTHKCAGIITRSDSKSSWSFFIVTEDAYDTLSPAYDVFKESLNLGD